MPDRSSPPPVATLCRAPMRIDAIFARPYFAPDQDAPADVKPPAKPADPKPDDTQAKIDAAVAAALEDQRKKIDAQAAKDKEELDRKAAEEKGEHLKLYEQEKAKREATEAENRRYRQSIALRDHLQAKHPEYAGSAVDILPHVPADADGDALAKAVDKASSDFIARNPRTAKTAGPQTPRTPGRANGAEIPLSTPTAPANGPRITQHASRF